MNDLQLLDEKSPNLEICTYFGDIGSGTHFSQTTHFTFSQKKENATSRNLCNNMMSDEVDEGVDEGPIDDPKVSQGRHRCIVIGILVVAALAIAAIVLPLTLDNCDCPSTPNVSSLRVTSNPTRAPVLPPVVTTESPTPAPVAIVTQPPVVLTPSPTESPAPSAEPSTLQVKNFIEVFLLPRFGAAPFQDTNSPQYRAAEFLADEDNIAKTSANVELLGDRYALVVLYYSTLPQGWVTCSKDDTNCANPWLNPDQTHCDWEFIGCDATSGRVVDLIFRK
jgi:hypothetical protein